LKEHAHEYVDFRYYTPSEFEKLGGLWPIRSGNNVAKANYAIGTRMIECYSIHFVLNGSVDFTFEEGKERLRKGDLFCLYPGRKHSYQVAEYTTHSPLRMCWLAFDGPQASHLLERIGLTEGKPYLHGKAAAEVHDLVQQIFDWMAEEGAELQLQQALYQLFAMLSLPPNEGQKKTVDWLKKCEDYISSHYMEPISVSDVAVIAGVHRSHLYMEFTRSYGMGPKHYLIQKRMEKASELLLQATLTVTEIALSLGYADVYAFSRAFYNFYSISPSNYRLQHHSSQ
jgi:AraC-like DNA-binding protein